MYLFYTPDISEDAYYTLNEQESLHAVRVLRLNQDDPVILVNGKGLWCEAILTRPHPKKSEVQIIKRISEYGKMAYELHIGLAPTKQIDRFEWFLEKATEIGITSITPLVCARSERQTVKQDRSLRVVVAAMKQSLKAYHPVINQVTSYHDFIHNDLSDIKLIAHCMAEENRHPLHSVIKKSTGITIIIGPEGDFTPDEIELALHNNFLPVTLGKSRYRTETAGIIACHTVALLNQMTK